MADLSLSRCELLSALGGAAAVTGVGGATMQSGMSAGTRPAAAPRPRASRPGGSAAEPSDSSGPSAGRGVLVHDLTAPTNPRFVQGVVNRDFSVTFGDLLDDPESPGRGGGFSPEGIEFVPVADSPVTSPLLAVGYEVSGTVGVFEVTPLPDGAPGRSGDAPGRGEGSAGAGRSS